jgi:hypothetical protein
MVFMSSHYSTRAPAHTEVLLLCSAVTERLLSSPVDDDDPTAVIDMIQNESISKE